MPSIEALTRIIDQLRAENEQLRFLLHVHGIVSPPAVPDVPEKPADTFSDRAVTKSSPMYEKLALFLSLFQGRPDVYARRWESKIGRSGYSPACVNEWKPGVCLKPKGKCADCANAAYNFYDERAVEDHLCGRHVLGVYPLLRDDACRFLHLDESSRTPAIGQYYDQIMQDDLRNSLIIDDVLHCIGEGRNCLLLSERTQHVKKLSELLCAQGKTAHVLLGGQTNAQMKKQMSALKNATDNQPLVICATGKFIGEGFDDSRLDTLFLTMPISWLGTLAQYVGRLHRLHEGKREVRVYDYIDNHAVMLEKMYHKRLRGYANIGYSVSADQRDEALGSDMIYDQLTFQERFLKDITQAKESITIVSPYVTGKRVRWIETALRQCAQKRVSVTVITRTPESLPVSSRRTAEVAAGMLREMQVNVIFREGIHQKYAIIDGSVVWYGSINLLSFGTSQESIMRLVSSSIARALQETKEG